MSAFLDKNSKYSSPRGVVAEGRREHSPPNFFEIVGFSEILMFFRKIFVLLTLVYIFFLNIVHLIILTNLQQYTSLKLGSVILAASHWSYKNKKKRKKNKKKKKI